MNSKLHLLEYKVLETMVRENVDLVGQSLKVDPAALKSCRTVPFLSPTGVFGNYAVMFSFLRRTLMPVGCRAKFF